MGQALSKYIFSLICVASCAADVYALLCGLLFLGVDNLTCQIVDSARQEMTASHRRIEDFEIDSIKTTLIAAVVITVSHAALDWVF